MSAIIATVKIIRITFEAWLEIDPEALFTARANGAFLGLAVRYLAAEAGIRQFLDIGAGIPTAGNTHQVAHAVTPDSRVGTWTMTIASRVMQTRG